MEIAGIAHVQLTVNDLQRAMPFYEKVLGFLGMMPVVKARNAL
jgi:predicted enzyme related to lactoylglutathione lyase